MAGAPAAAVRALSAEYGRAEPAEIARRMGVGPATVKTHVAAVLA
ncbi:hypothetical protein [Streptomyces sp. AcE210]|nr:hypothetical protein [Streptomyces sp. AcE210]